MELSLMAPREEKIERAGKNWACWKNSTEAERFGPRYFRWAGLAILAEHLELELPIMGCEWILSRICHLQICVRQFLLRNIITLDLVATLCSNQAGCAGITGILSWQ
jgi:hypothetical protein